MRGYVTDIEKITLENENFRRVLYTAKNCQLVVMSLKPGEDIGEEVHELDQFIRCEAGRGRRYSTASSTRWKTARLSSSHLERGTIS